MIDYLYVQQQGLLYVYDTSYDHVHVYLYHTLGTDVNTPEGQMKARAMLILCCVDLPAQALMLNMKSYNGKFACALCKDPGVPRASCHMHRNWPFTSNNVDRTSHTVRESYRQLLDSGAETVSRMIL